MQAAAMFLGLLPQDQRSFDMESEKGQAFASAVERFVCVILGEMCGDSETTSSRWFAACEERIQLLCMWQQQAALAGSKERICEYLYATHRPNHVRACH